MRDTTTKLYEAQRILLLQSPGSAKWVETVDALRASVPEPILAHFLRYVSGGRRGIALVRHGVCSECHIRVPRSLLPSLVKPVDMHLCDHCGSFLLLPEDEIPNAPAPTAVKVSPRGRKPRQPVAV